MRPASQARQAYGTAATGYDEEALLLLSDIDPALNANPGTFDMTTFAPTYALINGRPYDGTAGGTLPIVSAPGHDVLLRVVNAAVRFHPIGLLGLRESVVGESSHALRYPRSAISTTVAPGSTADALVHLPSAATAAGHYALYDTSLRLYNGTQAGYGGMLTTIDATGTWTTTCAGPVTSRVQAPDTTAGTGALAFTAYVTPCAAAPATTVTAAEYFIDTVGADGSGTAPAGREPAHGHGHAGADPEPLRRPAHDLRARPRLDRRLGRGLERHVHRRADRPERARDHARPEPDQPRPGDDAPLCHGGRDGARRPDRSRQPSTSSIRWAPRRPARAPRSR